MDMCTKHHEHVYKSSSTSDIGGCAHNPRSRGQVALSLVPLTIKTFESSFHATFIRYYIRFTVQKVFFFFFQATAVKVLSLVHFGETSCEYENNVRYLQTEFGKSFIAAALGLLKALKENER